ncbi:MAG: hypothetical protein CR982_09225 [Candidatus Cloacimonadota bacterium]|nr:MAG: hypothetical protein CR982_09225 [Candidatus Cloacimonadota bacterium]PIE77490.1 MAG: hypothetical protein CSA15_12515 [Candidatus Delongbacteria bacterium]
MENIYREIGKELEQRDNFLICSHFSPDGDNIGSSLAIHRFLKSIGKRSIISNQDPFPEKFKFLLKDDIYVKGKDLNEKFDNIIVLDIGSYNRLGDVRDSINRESFIINIDHHISNNSFGDLNLIKPKKAATAQMVYDLLVNNKFTINSSIAEPLYVGLLTDTGGFRYQSTDSEVLKVASDLSSYDIDPSDLIENAIYKNSAEDLKAISTLLSNFEVNKKLKLLTLFHDNTILKVDDNDMVLSMLNSVSNIDVVLYVRKISEGLVKGSFRSKKFDVSKFALKHGGGGHKNASGLRFNGTIDEFKKNILEDLIKDIEAYEDL